MVFVIIRDGSSNPRLQNVRYSAVMGVKITPIALSQKKVVIDIAEMNDLEI